MKIRTDFVTNSSSSSFVTINIMARDGNIHKLDLMDEYFNVETLPEMRRNTLVYSDYGDSVTISTVLDLLACIYFAQIQEPLPFDVSSTIFAFLMEMLSPQELRDKLKNIDGFEQLEDIDPDDYENEEDIREAIMVLLSNCLEEIDCYINICDESNLESYNNILKSIRTLADIEKIEFNFCDCYMDEGTDIFCELLEDILSQHEFTAIAVNDPAYQKQYNTWLKLLTDEVLVNCDSPSESIEVLVKKALSSGNPYNMIPSSVTRSNSFCLKIPEFVSIEERNLNGDSGIWAFSVVDSIDFEGKIFVLTGFGAQEEEKITQEIQKRGGTVKSSLVVKTDYLVVMEDYDHATTKYQKAKDLQAQGKNIAIISSKMFYAFVE